MPDRPYFEAEDFATREPLLEQYAQAYVNAYPQFDIVTARQIIDAHPAMQGILGREAPAGDTLVAAPDAPAPLKVGAHEWMGERLDIDPAVGHRLLAEYRAAAAGLHAAKERAKAVEQEIQQTLQGFEHGAIDGQDFFHWTFVNSTSFDAKSFKEDPERKALYDSFLVTKPTRRFKVDGTVGVD